MKTCSKLKEFIDWPAENEAPRADLKIHLAECAYCRTLLREWHAIESQISPAESQTRPEYQTSPSERSRLVQRVTNRVSTATPVIFGWRLAGVAALALVLLFFVYGLLRSTEVPRSPPVGEGILIANGASSAFVIDEESQQIDVPKHARAVVSLGRDALGIDGDSHLRLESATHADTRIVLNRGVVTCGVAPRKQGERFWVTAGDVRVRVVGTRFSVRRVPGKTTVAIDEGRVEVSLADGDRHLVGAGDQIDIDTGGNTDITPLSDENRRYMARLLSKETSPADIDEEHQDERVSDTAANAALPVAPETHPDTDSDRSRGKRPRATRHPSSKDIARWREWIIDGRTEEAARELRDHLKRHPRDAGAWGLLANCSRKRGDWQSALAAYEEIISVGSKREANRARFRAGAIMQDKMGNHRPAASLFETYIAGATGSMKAEAMLRLANAYDHMGRDTDARRLLREITREHRGTTAAARAQKMLNESPVPTGP